MGPFAVLGALAMCVVALAGYVLAGNTVKDREAELAAVTAEQEAVARQAAALKPYADFQTVAKSRVEGVKGLAKIRFDWHRALDDLSRALPAEVTLQSLSGAANTATASADAAAGTTAAAAPTIDLTGCTTGDDGVAKLISRLNNVRGVTKVALTTASRVEKTKDGAGTDAVLCSGDASNFTLQIAFERAVASTPAATATTPTTTTTATTSEGTTAP